MIASSLLRALVVALTLVAVVRPAGAQLPEPQPRSPAPATAPTDAPDEV
ncbi:MAG: hypothetical protein H0X17_22015, partial [Deltaproteobacteria bacterium]|nr:hypothetical protein [Deltaproteobacteria bacterium]